jgi:hypothetical protein
MINCKKCGRKYQSSSGDIEGICDVCKLNFGNQQGLSAGNAGYKENGTALNIFDFIKAINEHYKHFIGNGGSYHTSMLTDFVKTECHRFLKTNTIVKPDVDKIEKIVSKELKVNQKLYNKTYKDPVVNREHYLVISGRLQAIREIQRKCHFSL